MSTKTVGKEASVIGGELYFQTYQRLLKQKERIDRDLLKLQSKFFKVASRGSKVSSTEIGRKRYVPRLNNTTTLASAIRECMIPSKEMTMRDILNALEKRSLYHTSSKYFYTMVNNKIHLDKKIEKVGRGVFVYSPRKRVAVV